MRRRTPNEARTSESSRAFRICVSVFVLVRDTRISLVLSACLNACDIALLSIVLHALRCLTKLTDADSFAPRLAFAYRSIHLFGPAFYSFIPLSSGGERILGAENAKASGAVIA